MNLKHGPYSFNDELQIVTIELTSDLYVGSQLIFTYENLIENRFDFSIVFDFSIPKSEAAMLWERFLIFHKPLAYELFEQIQNELKTRKTMKNKPQPKPCQLHDFESTQTECEQEQPQQTTTEQRIHDLLNHVAEFLIYAIAAGFLVSVIIVVWLMIKHENEPPKPQPQKTTNKFIQVENEPQSEILDRVYYYDSVDSAYL